MFEFQLFSLLLSEINLALLLLILYFGGRYMYKQWYNVKVDYFS